MPRARSRELGHRHGWAAGAPADARGCSLLIAPVLLVKKEVAESKEATGIWRPGTKCATVVQEHRGMSGWQKQGLLGSVKGRLGI